MQYKSAVLVVTDMDRSVAFYKEVLGLEVILDFGANKTLTGGLALQSLESYKEFIGADIAFGGNGCEIYFEEDNFDAFAIKLDACAVSYVHPVKEHSWGQRVVRFMTRQTHHRSWRKYGGGVGRFLHSGMTPEQVAGRMDVPACICNRLHAITRCLRFRSGRI